MTKQWIPKALPTAEISQHLAAELQVNTPIANLLAQRGITDFEAARAFFRPALEKLHNPFLMKDMDRAVSRLTEAIEKGERILVYGDYDVDGTTAVTVMYSFISSLGVPSDYYIPDRYAEGYGFSMKAVDFAHDNDFTLIITLDCGIKDKEKIVYANSKGIDIIICDHHNPGELPPAYAILDPKREDCAYPYKGLSGCGVGFKLIQAFCKKNGIDESTIYPFLDLVTVAIGADIVPLTDENRIMAYYGMEMLQTNRRPGINAMLESAGFNKPQLTITDVVFVIAPRINAAGRIISGRDAVKLLLTQDADSAKKLSAGLEENNTTRKGLDKSITEHAIQMIEADSFYKTSYASVVAHEDWHKGVVGIVASRLVEQYYKPSIVMVEIDGKLAGSARSIPGLDLFDALDKCSDLLIQFGGHTMAAGLSLYKEKFHEFRKRFDEVVAEMLGHVHPIPYIEYDLELQPNEVDAKFYRILAQFSPFGPENMKPTFMIRNLVNAGGTRIVGETREHLKLQLKSANPEEKGTLEGIGFYKGAWEEEIAFNQNPVDLLCVLEENHFNGRVTIQLNVKDIRLSVLETAQ